MAGKVNSVNGQFAGNNHFMPSSFVAAGNPNTNTGGNSQAGQIGDIYFDTTGDIGYTCSTGGASGTAVWTADSASTSAFTWSNVTTTTQAMAVNNGYVSSNAALSTFTLPTTIAIGQRVAVQGAGVAGWTIAQNSGQSIVWSGGTTTTGAGGSLSSSGQYDEVELICLVANTLFAIRQVQGNPAWV